MKKICIALFLIFASTTFSYSQVLFSENFNYPVRDTLHSVGGWFGLYTNDKFVKVVSPGLTYTGYTASGIGNSAYFSNSPDGNASIVKFGYVDTGTVYMSFLMRVENLSATAKNGFCIALDEQGSSTNINTVTYIKKVNSTTYKIGINKSYDTNAVYLSGNYTVNTTYLIVVSYTFKPGVNDDISKIHVFSSGVPVNEPAFPGAKDSLKVDISNIGDIFLSNSFLQSDGLNNSAVKIDGIRIGKTWNSTLFQNYICQLSMKAYIQGLYNNVTNKMVKDTVTVSLRYNKAPYALAETVKSTLDSNGSGTFNFTKVGNYALYYLQVDHRNTLESWSKFLVEFENNVKSYDFIYNSNQTYGNNVIQKGNRFCFYNGEIVHDGIIDVTDYQFVDNNSFNFAAGYKTTDLNGDNITDIDDLAIVELNAFNFVQVVRP